MVKTALLGAAIAAAVAVADVTISVSDVPPLPLRKESAVTSATDLWAKSCPEEHSPRTPYNASLLLSAYTSFQQDEAHGDAAPVFAPGTVYPSSDSIVRGALEAWAQHQHLVLRPDEVWFEVLAQLNFYMNAHAEDVRHLFVDFSGKQEIVVKAVTWTDVLGAFAGAIQRRIKTDWLEAWIMPGFTTSTPNDGLTATVLMMGLMKHYFEFTGGITCGLPKVTLLGQREDWVRLLAKLDRLPEFGAEPKQYAANLRPIFARFVRTFDEGGAESRDIKSFWGQIVRAEHHSTCGKGPIEYTITGWVLGFLHWNEDGQLRVRPEEDVEAGDEAARFPSRRDTTPVTLDNITYVSQPMDELPVGYATVPLKMLDFPAPGTDSYAFLLAGNVGVNRTENAGDGGYVRAQPMSSWFMYGPVDPEYNATAGSLGSFAEVKNIYNGMEVQESCPGYQKPITFPRQRGN